MLNWLSQQLADWGVHASQNAIFTISCLLCLMLGMSIIRIWKNKQIHQLNKKHQLFIDNERTRHEDHIDHLSHVFNNLSKTALQENSESFLTLAQQQLTQSQKQTEQKTEHQLSLHQHNIQHLLSPIKETLTKTNTQLHDLTLDRVQTETKLTQHINTLAQSQQNLQKETRNLVTALRRPEVRGQWGETSLRRLVELAGMNQFCDFSEQVNITNEDGKRFRPDMLIRLPNERNLVVDVKTPLDAYISANECSDVEKQIQYLNQHSSNLKKRIKELSSKRYWQQFSQSPEFVILFIPGEQFLHAALECDASLLEFAFENKIILSTPTSFIALLKTIAYGWKQNKMSENTVQIQQLADTLNKQIEHVSTQLTALGKHLHQSLECFHQFNTQYQSKVISTAKQITSLDSNTD